MTAKKRGANRAQDRTFVPETPDSGRARRESTVLSSTATLSLIQQNLQAKTPASQDGGELGRTRVAETPQPTSQHHPPPTQLNDKAAQDSAAQSRRKKARRMASQLPTELSFYLASQTDALSSTILPDSQPPPKQRQTLHKNPISTSRPLTGANKPKAGRAEAAKATPAPPTADLAPEKEYSPRGAKLSALVALVDTVRSPSQQFQRSPVSRPSTKAATEREISASDKSEAVSDSARSPVRRHLVAAGAREKKRSSGGRRKSTVAKEGYEEDIFEAGGTRRNSLVGLEMLKIKSRRTESHSGGNKKKGGSIKTKEPALFPLSSSDDDSGWEEVFANGDASQKKFLPLSGRASIVISGNLKSKAKELIRGENVPKSRKNLSRELPPATAAATTPANSTVLAVPLPAGSTPIAAAGTKLAVAGNRTKRRAECARGSISDSLAARLTVSAGSPEESPIARVTEPSSSGLSSLENSREPSIQPPSSERGNGSAPYSFQNFSTDSAKQIIELVQAGKYDSKLAKPPSAKNSFQQLVEVIAAGRTKTASPSSLIKRRLSPEPAKSAKRMRKGSPAVESGRPTPDFLSSPSVPLTASKRPALALGRGEKTSLTPLPMEMDTPHNKSGSPSRRSGRESTQLATRASDGLAKVSPAQMRSPPSPGAIPTPPIAKAVAAIREAAAASKPTTAAKQLLAATKRSPAGKKLNAAGPSAAGATTADIKQPGPLSTFRQPQIPLSRQLAAKRSPTASASVAAAATAVVTEDGDESMEELPPTQAVPLLEGLTLFVEVRSGHDNRTRAIQANMRALGATISEKVTRQVTHVIFKEGTRANFLKAKRLGLPILSVLWVEACKEAGKLVPWDSYPSTSLERYNSPGLFPRIRKLKSIQPRSFEEDMAIQEKKLQRRLAKEAKARQAEEEKQREEEEMKKRHQELLISAYDKIKAAEAAARTKEDPINKILEELRSPGGSPFRFAAGEELSPPRPRRSGSPFCSSDTDYETPLAQRIVRRLKRKRMSTQRATPQSENRQEQQPDLEELLPRQSSTVPADASSLTGRLEEKSAKLDDSLPRPLPGRLQFDEPEDKKRRDENISVLQSSSLDTTSKPRHKKNQGQVEENETPGCRRSNRSSTQISTLATLSALHQEYGDIAVSPTRQPAAAADSAQESRPQDVEDRGGHKDLNVTSRPRINGGRKNRQPRTLATFLDDPGCPSLESTRIQPVASNPQPLSRSKSGAAAMSSAQEDKRPRASVSKSRSATSSAQDEERPRSSVSKSRTVTSSAQDEDTLTASVSTSRSVTSFVQAKSLPPASVSQKTSTMRAVSSSSPAVSASSPSSVTVVAVKTPQQLENDRLFDALLDGKGGASKEKRAKRFSLPRRDDEQSLVKPSGEPEPVPNGQCSLSLHKRQTTEDDAAVAHDRRARQSEESESSKKGSNGKKTDWKEAESTRTLHGKNMAGKEAATTASAAVTADAAAVAAGRAVTAAGARAAPVVGPWRTPGAAAVTTKVGEEEGQDIYEFLGFPDDARTNEGSKQQLLSPRRRPVVAASTNNGPVAKFGRPANLKMFAVASVEERTAARNSSLVTQVNAQSCSDKSPPTIESDRSPLKSPTRFQSLTRSPRRAPSDLQSETVSELSLGAVEALARTDVRGKEAEPGTRSGKTALLSRIFSKQPAEEQQQQQETRIGSGRKQHRLFSQQMLDETANSQDHQNVISVENVHLTNGSRQQETSGKTVISGGRDFATGKKKAATSVPESRPASAGSVPDARAKTTSSLPSLSEIPKSCSDSFKRPALQEKKRGKSRKNRVDSSGSEASDTASEPEVPAASSTRSSRRSSADFAPLPRFLQKMEQRRDTNAAETSQNSSNSKRRSKPSGNIVCTSCHRDDINLVNQLVSQYGRFSFSTAVNARTSHVVSGEGKRTLNLLKGLLQGCWLVTKEWVMASLEAGDWVEEEPYEMTDFSPAVKALRLEKAAFQGVFRSELFKEIGTIFVSDRCRAPKDELKQLVVAGGGSVSNQIRVAQVCVGEKREGSSQHCVTEKWILDSIQFHVVMPFTDYPLS